MPRVITYVDGFNLYFGLRASRLGHCRWLNLQNLASRLLLPSQELVRTKYFTARIAGPADKQKRQTTYIEALETLDNFDIFYGHYQSMPQTCRACGDTYVQRSEKMTDVNIAVELLTDAFQDRFDIAILISADSDLTAPITAIRRLFPRKKVVVAFPPERQSYGLSKVANNYLTIQRNQILASLFPLQVRKADGFILHCPAKWQ